MASPAVSAVSVVVPTVGRAVPLRACLESLVACTPRAAEILVVDQSGTADVAEVVGSFARAGVLLVSCDGKGVARGRNDGLRTARHETVLVTDDDCTVAPDWVGVGSRLAEDRPAAIVTGRVVAVGDPSAVPSTKEDPEPRDLSGERRGGVLFPNNMVLPRSLVLGAGGFDERFGPEEAAEDNDFCYRWLKSGRSLYYEPELVVNHHDWRTPEQLERLYARYARGEGFFYAKHLSQGDLRMLRFIVRDLAWGVRSLGSAVVKRRPRWTDHRRATLRSLPGGFIHGWRTYGSGRKSRALWRSRSS